MNAKDLMTINPVTCRADDSLAHAAQLMWESDIGCVPVVDDAGGVIGMLTDRDICMAAYTQGCSLAAGNVGSAMSKSVYACSPGDSITFAEEQMRQEQVRRLPVIDKGKLVGLISLNDLAIAAGNRKKSKTGAVMLDEVATTLARICEHRDEQTSAAAQ
jgi:CBS domain-containing protein